MNRKPIRLPTLASPDETSFDSRGKVPPIKKVEGVSRTNEMAKRQRFVAGDRWKNPSPDAAF